jgi:protein-tyrosine phosphatase
VSTSTRARRIALESCHNFRDFGGYETEDGRRLRWRTVFRSDSLSKLSPSDIETLQGLGIHTVIDLRSTREIERSGRIAEEVPSRYYHLPMFENIEEYEARAKLAERPPPGDTYIEMLTGGSDAICGTLRALLEAEGRPSVIHCTAGKDRTGILSGLVLSALGVSNEDVVADYVLTNESWEARIAYLEQHDPEYLTMLRRVPSSVRTAQPTTIQAVLDHVTTGWGSVPAYLESTGISTPELEALGVFLSEP